MYHKIYKSRNNRRRQQLLIKSLLYFLSVIPAESGAKVDRRQAQHEQTDRWREAAFRIQQVRRITDKIRQLRTETSKKVENRKCLKTTVDSSLRTMAREQSSQDLWTSWLDGWSSQGPGMDLGVEPTSTTISNISLRLDQKVNGLFDNGEYSIFSNEVVFKRYIAYTYITLIMYVNTVSFYILSDHENLHFCTLMLQNLLA